MSDSSTQSLTEKMQNLGFNSLEAKSEKKIQEIGYDHAQTIFDFHNRLQDGDEILRF
jgi:hypothetical protein